jgi:hypothetical protein
MPEKPKSFSELLADKYIETAGRTERERRGWQQSSLDTEAPKIAYDPIYNTPVERALRAREFLTVCGIVARNMGKVGEQPYPEVEVCSQDRTSKWRGAGWLIWEQADAANSRTEGVLLNTDGVPFAYAGQPSPPEKVRRRRHSVEVRRLGDISVSELTVDTLTPPETHDVDAYVSGLVDLAFTHKIQVEWITTGLHLARSSLAG